MTRDDVALAYFIKFVSTKVDVRESLRYQVKRAYEVADIFMMGRAQSLGVEDLFDQFPPEGNFHCIQGYASHWYNESDVCRRCGQDRKEMMRRSSNHRQRINNMRRRTAKVTQ